MDVVTEFINKIAYKFPKGYPDMNDPADKELLESLMGLNEAEEDDEEEKLIDKLISTIRSSGLSDDELNSYIKSINNKGLTGDLKDKLSKKGI